MSSDDFHGSEWDLANIAANTTSGDAFLVDLIRLAESGVSSVVGVLANGMVIAGAVSTGRAIAEQLDRQMSSVVEGAQRPEDIPEEKWQERLKYWTSRNQDIFEQINEDRKRLEEQLASQDWSGPDRSKRPEGFERDALENSIRTTLTLVNVQISAPGQNGVLRTDVIRIAMDQISGWWPVPVDAEGRASFSLFVTDD